MADVHDALGAPTAGLPAVTGAVVAAVAGLAAADGAVAEVAQAEAVPKLLESPQQERPAESRVAGFRLAESRLAGFHLDTGPCEEGFSRVS